MPLMGWRNASSGLVGPGEDPESSMGGGERFLYELKADPGALSTETFRREVAKLERVKALGLPTDLFEGWTEKLVIAWRDRAARCFLSDLVESPRQVRLTLLAALCHARTTEITDRLVELMIQLVLRIDTRAERRVEKEWGAPRFPVRGKSLTGREMTVFGGQVLSTYTHVSDQHSTYGTKVIVPTTREAHYVLDDFLGNATDLPIHEHATDTHGVTLINFALFGLVGKVLSPRIRDLGKITLCRDNTPPRSPNSTRTPDPC